MPLSESPLPLSDRSVSKKAQILKLASAGYSDREIAAEISTTEGYVAKAKSEAKRAAVLKGRPNPVSLPAQCARSFGKNLNRKYRI